MGKKYKKTGSYEKYLDWDSGPLRIEVEYSSNQSAVKINKVCVLGYTKHKEYRLGWEFLSPVLHLEFNSNESLMAFFNMCPDSIKALPRSSRSGEINENYKLLGTADEKIAISIRGYHGLEVSFQVCNQQYFGSKHQPIKFEIHDVPFESVSIWKDLLLTMYLFDEFDARTIRELFFAFKVADFFCEEDVIKLARDNYFDMAFHLATLVDERFNRGLLCQLGEYCLSKFQTKNAELCYQEIISSGFKNGYHKASSRMIQLNGRVSEKDAINARELMFLHELQSECKDYQRIDDLFHSISGLSAQNPITKNVYSPSSLFAIAQQMKRLVQENAKLKQEITSLSSSPATDETNEKNNSPGFFK
ncbi:hypothetical protein TUM19329_03310 [Legionella antarctica]|uniref:Uncharacterized protein n=1 Tax=Legionella antarctica TaxID=2708020 RepID=A0A6F8T1D6_9GAMM|nr:hypothetical protein [Legionella antarctica]BCA93970.1 hypothetical protein TUM19329_03310 [Legionella antarctica]